MATITLELFENPLYGYGRAGRGKLYQDTGTSQRSYIPERGLQAVSGTQGKGVESQGHDQA